MAAVRGELLFFLDDDARLASPDALARVAARLTPDVGLLQLRVAPLDRRRPPRDWVPRLRVGDPARSSDVTAVWEGAVAMPRAVFEQVGGWPAEFRFAHEGVDLAWRVLDTGYRVLYAGDIAALHPAYATAPHDYSAYYGARNRVWLARRHLPLPLAVLYVARLRRRTLPLCPVALADGAGGARLPRRPARAVRAAQAASREDPVADDRAGRPPIV